MRESCIVDDEQHVRPTLHLSQDMGSASWLGSVWLVCGLQLRGSLSWDLFHRRTNDLADATSQAGMTIIKLEMSAVLGLRRGPWGKDGNHDVLISAAHEMFRLLDENSELFDFFYDHICEDLSEFPMDKGSPEHYTKVWELCRKHLTSAGVGHAPKNSRWWAVETLARAQRHLRSMTLMLLIFVGYRRGWWSSFDQTPMFASIEKPLEEAKEADARGLEILEREGKAEDDEDDDDLGKDEPAAKRVSLSAGRAEMRKRRSQCVSQMQYAARVLARKKSCRLFDAMEFLSRPLEHQFAEESVLCKTQDGTLQLMQSLANNSGNSCVRKVMEQFQSTGLLQTLGILVDPSSRNLCLGEKTMADTAWSFALAMAGSVACSNMKYRVPPRSFMGLTLDTGEQRARSLAFHKEVFDCITKLEQYAEGSAEAQRWIQNMEWPFASVGQGELGVLV